MEGHRETQLGNGHRDLPAVAAREVRTDGASLVRILRSPPEVAVVELVLLGVVVRAGREVRPFLRIDAATLPHAAIQVQLRKLEEVARQEARAAGDREIAAWRERQVITLDV